MSNTRFAKPMSLAVITATALLAMECANGSDYEPDSVSSLHYVETITGSIDGESIDSREEGYYKAPDSAHVTGDAEYSALGLEEIVIGSRVWTRNILGRPTASGCYNALSKAEWILRLGGERAGYSDEDDGPIVAGEPTRRLKWTSDDAGRNLITATERNLADTPENAELLASTEEVFGGLTGIVEVIVGDETGRAYSYSLNMTGPRLTQQTEITVEYDAPVEIEAPEDVESFTESRLERSECELGGGDFPWIPAVAAAILGPPLFLVGSSYVWPHRPSIRS